MIVTEISVCKKSKDRCNVYVDGEFAYALFLDTILDNGIKVGETIDADTLKAVAFEDGCKKCYLKGCYLLSFRQRGEKELKERLFQSGYSREEIEYALKELKERGYINDEAFGEEYAEYLHKKGYGPYVIKHKLLEKGIDKDLAETLAGDGDGDGAREYGEKAFAKAMRQQDEYAQKRKFMDAMTRRGFSFEVAKKVFAELKGEEDFD